MLDDKSLQKLATCDQKLIDLFMEVSKHIQIKIIHGHRTQEEQAEIVANGFSKTQNSKHCEYPSRAVDFAPLKNGKIDWNDKATFYYVGGIIQGVALSMGIDVRYGGDWDGDGDTQDQTFMDLGHIELE